MMHGVGRSSTSISTLGMTTQLQRSSGQVEGLNLMLGLLMLLLVILNDNAIRVVLDVGVKVF
jgi:hypothetical protein